MSSKPTKQTFLHQAPAKRAELSTAANIALLMGSLSSRLVRIERTRCAHPDGRSENVAEHCLMLAKVAPELAAELYPELDANLVARFAVIHDDVEAYVGDTPTDILAKLDAAAKAAREAAGLKQLAREYASLPGYVHYIEQYEAQSVPEARFVRAVDKLMVLLIHEPNQGSVLRRHYDAAVFLSSEQALLERDGYKYGEFDKIKELRRELGRALADSYLTAG